MKVSIVVPVYKVEEIYLRKCLDSLQNQTYQDCEFIIVDDGSPDDCGEICDGYAKNDARFKVYHLENHGVSYARNYGISKSCGDYLLFVDGDDFIELDLCMKLHDVLKRCDTDILFFKFSDGVSNKFGTESSDVYVPDKDFIERIRIENVSQRENRLNLDGYRIGSPWGKLFKKVFLVDNCILFTIGLKKSQDRIFMLDCLEHTDYVAFANVNGYNYVLRGGSVTHKYNPNIHEIMEKFKYELKKRVEGKKEYDSAVQELYVILLLEEMMLDVFKKQSKYSINEGARYIREQASNDTIRAGLKNINPNEYNLKRRLVISALKYGRFRIAGLLSSVFWGVT